jgi:hypothetical protein
VETIEMAKPTDKDLIPAINRLVGDIDRRDAETAEMKRTVNRLCDYAGLPAKYSQVEDPNAGAHGIRIMPGQFYQRALATAVGDYLKMRGDPNKGGMGPGTISEIYAALLEGGFQFDAKSDDTAKRALSISLAKNTQTFERLPTGQIGLKTWYRHDD